MKNYNKGFTLIELLIVITIMSILTVITVSQFMTARAKARDVARKGDLNSVSKAVLMYYNDYGTMPASVGGEISVDGSSGIDWGTEFKDGSYTYMKVLPVENTKSNPPYCYAVDATRKKFAIFAQLESLQDVDCHLDGSGVGIYNQCGSNYCYSVVSPNATVADF